MLESSKWTRITGEVINELEDHYFYLAVVEGYGTPMKVKFHRDSIMDFTWFCNDKHGIPRRYSAMCDDKRVFYIRPLPEFPDGYNWEEPPETGFDWDLY